jgi:hypothetical protein
LRSLSDDEVIEMIEVSKNFDRELLVSCLGFSAGGSGVPYLRSLLEERGRGSGHLRVQVLNTLAVRLRQSAAPELIAALKGGTYETQLAAVTSLQEVDEDGRFASEILEWLQRRLRTFDRAPFELSGTLLYAQRVGALRRTLELLERHQEKLSSGEVEWLERSWPRRDRDRYLDAEDAAHEPDQRTLWEWWRVAATMPPPAIDPDAPFEADEYVETAIRRARRRLEKRRN